MKYFMLCIVAFTILVGQSRLSALEDSHDAYLTYYWSIFKDELRLNVNLSEEMIFSDSYQKTAIKNGQSCEVICRPQYPGRVRSKNGYELQEIRLCIVLKNTVTADQVICKITQKCFYEGINNNEKNVSLVSEHEEEMILSTPAIELSKAPTFYIVNDTWKEGIISFLNAYSRI